MNQKKVEACLTMHQPWASLLVYGIKRIEGRNWPSPLTGRLWIHAAGKVPDAETIKAMEDFYREIYALDGITDLQFPDHYPVSRLLGCVEVVGCVKCEELACWEEVPAGVRLEALTKFCWLCEKAQKLTVPFEMRGNQGVYNLDRKVYEAAIRGICQIEASLLVKFPLPDPRDPFSLKPGSLKTHSTGLKASEVERSPSLVAAIAGARAAATQFSKKEQTHQTNRVQESVIFDSSTRMQPRNSFTANGRNSHAATTQFLKTGRTQQTIAVQERAITDSTVRRQQPRHNYSEDRKYRVTQTQLASDEHTHHSNMVQERTGFDTSIRRQPRNQYTEDRESRSAATQFLRNEQTRQTNMIRERVIPDSSIRRQANNNFTVDRKSAGSFNWRPQNRDPVHGHKEQSRHMDDGGNSDNVSQGAPRDLNLQAGASSKIFLTAIKDLRLA